MDAPDPAPANGYDATVQRVLSVARSHLGMDVAWASEFTGDSQVFTHVDTDTPGAGPEQGGAGDLAGSYCLRVVDGRLPRVIPDARAHPVTGLLAVTELLDIGAYVGVPIRRADGRVRGMLCCTSSRPDRNLGTRDLAVLEMLAQILAELAAPHDDDHDRLAALTARVEAAITGSGRTHVLQPIVDVLTGHAVGMESLARFALPPQGPAAWFAEAEQVGLRRRLEAAAAATALGDMARGGRAGYLSVNLSPDVIFGPELPLLLLDVDLRRVVLEITEHAPVEDYELLVTALAPYRAAGLRLAIDDAGAGFASFRHILRLDPDFIKIDLSLVRDIDHDPVRQALARSLVAFADSVGATLIAEGVETQAELDTLVDLGVRLMQGYLLCRPCDEPPLTGYPGPSVTVTSPSVTGAVVF